MKKYWLNGGLLAGVVLGALVSCSDPSGPARDGRQLTVTGADQSDTIDARLSTPLRVVVRDSAGRPVSEATVVLRNLASEVGASVLFGPAVNGQEWQPEWLGETDTNGAVARYVRMGLHAGTAEVIVLAGFEDVVHVDTVSFQVLPGAAVGITVLPADTVLYVDVGYPLIVRAADRLGNARTEGVASSSFTVLDAGVSVTTAGVLTAQEEGRSRVEVSADGHLDTAWVSVVPRGTMAVARESAGPGTPPRGLYIMNLDGSHSQQLYAVSHTDLGPRWHPAGQYLVVHGPVRVDLNREAVLLPGAPSQANHPNAWNVFAPTGDTLYFEGGNPGSLYPVIWRMPAAGGAAEQATQFPCMAPTLSPDGTQMVCASDARSDHLVMVTLATGDTITFAPGFNPRWSPDGQWIAYSGRGPGIQDRLVITRADRTETRVLGDQTFWGGIDWSPDSRYVIAKGGFGQRIQLVRIADGELIPLSHFSRHFFQAAWRP